MEWREADGVRWLEALLPGAGAVFSTRAGGVSEAPFDRLNLGALTGDDLDAVVENRRRLAGALGFAGDEIAISLQVHGADLAIHSELQRPSPFMEPGAAIPEVDGHVTAEPGLPLLVFVADCLPVALSGPDGVAMLHCGWRGLAAGIISHGVDAVGATAAAIGPGIGPCCYEVGEEVIDAFSGLGTNAPSGSPGPGVANADTLSRTLNLAEVARTQLRRAGVEQIETAGLCTSCEAALFFSHRRDGGRTGRHAGVVWRTAGED
jgi:YfiH family protein